MITLHLEKQGETITFFSDPDPTAPSVEFECTIAPGANGPDPHIHPMQTETFRVTQGRMRAIVEGNERIIEEGDSIVITPGQVHSFSNGDADRPLNLRITMEPALNFQWMLTEAARSAIRNGGSWKDAPLLEQAYILQQTIDEHALPKVPQLVTRILMGTLAGLAVVLRKTGEITPLARKRAAA